MRIFLVDTELDSVISLEVEEESRYFYYLDDTSLIVEYGVEFSRLNQILKTMTYFFNLQDAKNFIQLDLMNELAELNVRRENLKKRIEALV